MKVRPVAACLLLPLLAAAAAPPPWAYGFKEAMPPNAPPAAAPTPASLRNPPLPDAPVLRLPGAERGFTPAEIKDNFGPADWFPGDHPPPPAIVARGRAPEVWACARCHYANGLGRPENAPIAGLPVDYFVAQLRAFRRGERQSSDIRKPNLPLMIHFARELSEDEMRLAAEYYGALRRTPWIRVVETDRVPRTALSAGMFVQQPPGDEPIGDRIVEVPAALEAVEVYRNPRVGFVAYVPPDSRRRGAALAATGGSGGAACFTCHGAELRGMNVPGVGAVPGLAGCSPSYLFRQLFDIKTGARHGGRTDLMKPVVAGLTADDMLAVVAYVASLPP